MFLIGYLCDSHQEPRKKKSNEKKTKITKSLITKPLIYYRGMQINLKRKPILVHMHIHVFLHYRILI